MSPPFRGLEVPAVRLADAIGEGCDLLKLDCEGAEFELLLGIPAGVLRRARHVACEVHLRAGDAGALVRRLRDCGFATRLRRKRGRPLALLYADRY